MSKRFSVQIPTAVPWLAAVVLLAGCSGSGPKASEVNFSGSPLVLPFGACSAHDDQLFVTAQLERNSRGEFGVDLLNKYRVLPVRLDVKRSRGGPDDDGGPELSEPTLAPQCFLENGMYLQAIPPAELRGLVSKKYRNAVEAKALKFNKIDNVDSSLSGFLYFRIPKNFRIEDSRILVAGTDGVVHDIDLLRSLIRFRYNYIQAQTSELRDFCVGLR